jgi:predicted aldo/keto reductase-like oxidoreductase
MFDRREFLRRSAALGSAPLFLPLAEAAAADTPTPSVRRRVPLGVTGLEVPDIGFGASQLSGEVDVVRHALDRGITYFDSAEGYTRGASEETLGEALAGRRDEVLLTSKTKCGVGTRRADLFEALEGSLGRLRTDHVDVYFNHAVNDVARLENEEWGEFVSRAKQQGKIRFSGFSGHGGRLVACLEKAVDDALVDVVLVAHNFGQDPTFLEQFTGRFDFVATQPDLPPVLKKARARGVGVVAMKTLRGGRLNDMRPYEGGGATFSQAAFRWVLSAGLVDSLVVSMTSQEQVDEYLGASGWTAPHHADAGLLTRYTRLTNATQCRYGCDACDGACPHGVPIPDLLRARMYGEDYGAKGLAREALAELGAVASACLACDGSPCAGACPHGLDTADLGRRAARFV